MKNIKKLKPIRTIIFENGNDKLILMQNETVVKLITDKSEYEEDYEGLITFVNEDGIGIENKMIYWEYIEEVYIL
jgi:hypothetical protein